MARCEDFPCCGHEAGCCPDFDPNTGEQLNMVCVCGKKLPIDNPSSCCDACLRSGPEDGPNDDEVEHDPDWDDGDYDSDLDNDDPEADIGTHIIRGDLSNDDMCEGPYLMGD